VIDDFVDAFRRQERAIRSGMTGLSTGFASPGRRTGFRRFDDVARRGLGGIGRILREPGHLLGEGVHFCQELGVLRFERGDSGIPPGQLDLQSGIFQFQPCKAFQIIASFYRGHGPVFHVDHHRIIIGRFREKRSYGLSFFIRGLNGYKKCNFLSELN